MKSSRIIVFDVDDTLYLEREFALSGYRAVSIFLCEQQRIAPQQQQVLWTWMWKRFQNAEYDNTFGALSDEFDLSLNPAEIMDLVDVYRNHRPQIQLLDGIPELLDTLSGDSQTGLGLVSDGIPQAQRNKFESLQLDRWIRNPTFTGLLGEGAGKPSLMAFEKVMADFPQTTPKNFLYVADNLAKDFVAPNRLGWGSVCVRWDGQVHAHKPAPEGGEPNQTVNSVEELREVLLQLF